MTDYPLITSHIGDARLNWHPQVHQHFDEDLYFVLFRLFQPHDVAAALASLMSEAGIQGFCAYVVIGYFDGLVRVWLTPQHWQRFLRVLSRHRSDFPEIRHLKVESLRYMWSIIKDCDLLAPGGPSSAFATLVEGEKPAIRRVAQNPTLPPPDDSQRLLDKGLMLVKPEEPGAVIKAFVVLQPTGGLGNVPTTADQFADGLLLNPIFKNCSVYSGDGSLASHLIRFTVKSYDAVLTATRAIDAVISHLPLRPMTLLVADAGSDGDPSGPTESDNVNNSNALTAAEHRTATLLEVDIDQIALLDGPSRTYLDRLASELAELLSGSTEWTTAKAILRACVTNDRRSVRQHLSFVLDFEYYFREYVKITLRDAYGPAWTSLVVDKYATVFRNISEDAKETADSWPLGVVHSLLRYAVEDDSQIKAQVLSTLGQNWSDNVRAVLNMRNPFAHGKLAGPTTRVDHLEGEWGDSVAQILRALPLYASLYNVTEGEYK